MFKPYNELTEVEKVERAIFILECKDHWTSADWSEMSRLQSELRELKEAASNN